MFKSKFAIDPSLLHKDSVYTLNNGVKMPVIGFGTWQAKDGEEAYESVKAALRVGYRHIDTAEAYHNEESVGRAIRDSGIPREEIFVTTKLTNTHLTYEDAKQAIDASLKRLGLDYVDQYLIHWPNPINARTFYKKRNAEVYRAMEEAYFAGKIRSIGVSNFHPHHLKALLKTIKVKPATNQIYVSPSDTQPKVVAFNEKHNILTVAYSPLGTGRLLGLNELNQVGTKYNKRPAQVAIRWSLEHGYLPLPKSTNASRISENFDVFDFKLSKEDIKLINSLKGKAGKAPDPDNVIW